jgi:hypothetical protein
VLKELCRKVFEVEARERRVLLPHKIFVIPMGLFDLETDSFDGCKFFVRDVDNKTTGVQKKKKARER